MFSKGIAKKWAITVLLLSVVMIIGIGCSKKVTLEDVTDNNNNNTQNENPNNNQDNNQNNNPNNDQNNGNNQNDPEQTRPNNSSDVQFLNINLVGGEPPLQQKEGIYYFTKTQHPPQVDSSFRYDTHNGWLIQLDDAAYYGQRVRVQTIKKNGNIFDITVRLSSGGDRNKPAYGFFEVGIFDMPTSAQFRIYNDAGQKLWPKF